ncbi:LysR family transcriptional regulator [Polycladomyces sp. WAk]|uniref:LysR family transcriptional regulator n=1 Tax=Polycladomyces zharkentensis TaxID=2807616 RepID=A0ABS2WHE2_9BACL|nr:LysR family transcriptional regulator [Polycladomyces sp. WAk]MBN2908745.1 LysR family transcriptional regulator [Polycladomyces sp. WAk]
MHIQQLITFLTVAKHRHFRQAGEELMLTQPAVSAQIRSLEEELGCTLFHRPHVSLTPEGKTFLPYAQKMVSLYEESKHALHQRDDDSIIRVTIGVDATLAPFALQRLSPHFQPERPQVHIRMLTLTEAQIIQALEEGRIDLGIAYRTGIPFRFPVSVLVYDTLTLAVSFQNPIARFAYLPLKRLPETPVILPAPGTTERRLIDEQLERHDLTIDPVLELPDLETLKQAVAQGIGVALLPRMALTHDQAGWRLLRIPELHPQLPVCLFHPDRGALTPALRRLVDDLRGIYPPYEE